MSSEKKIRILWDIYESVLLLDATLSVYQEGKDEKKIVRELSASLRAKAIQQNIDIDEYYRNINGINLKMQEMLYLLSKGDRGIAKASKQFKEAFRLFEEEPEKYQELLKEAKAMFNEIDKQP